MKAKAIDIIIKVLNFGKRLMLTIFAGLFAFSAFGALCSSITYNSLVAVIGCAIFAFCAALCWSIRRD